MNGFSNICVKWNEFPSTLTSLRLTSVHNIHLYRGCTSASFTSRALQGMPPAIEPIPKADLVDKFHLPLSEVAKHFRVSQTFIKKVCRMHNIPRWPFRKVTCESHVHQHISFKLWLFERARARSAAPTHSPPGLRYARKSARQNYPRKTWWDAIRQINMSSTSTLTERLRSQHWLYSICR